MYGLKAFHLSLLDIDNGAFAPTFRPRTNQLRMLLLYNDYLIEISRLDKPNSSITVYYISTANSVS